MLESAWTSNGKAVHLYAPDFFPFLRKEITERQDNGNK